MAKHRWTWDERRAVHLLFTEWNLVDAQVIAIFEAMYPHFADMERKYAHKYPREEWDGRFKDKKSTMWWEIIRPNDQHDDDYTQGELDTFARIRHDIQQAAGRVAPPINLAALAVNSARNTVGGTYIPPGSAATVAAGPAVAGNIAAASDAAAAGQGAQLNAPAANDGDHNGDDVMEDVTAGEDDNALDENMGEEDQSKEAAQDDRSTNEYQLDMVHFICLGWERDHIEFDREVLSEAMEEKLEQGVFVPKDSETYKLGGPVMQVRFDKMARDIMICNRSLCRVCNGNVDDTVRDDYKHTEGYPVVHRRDIAGSAAAGQANQVVLLKDDRYREYDCRISSKVEMGSACVEVIGGIRQEDIAVACCSGACEVCDGAQLSAEDIWTSMLETQHLRI